MPASPRIDVAPVPLDAILAMREEYRRVMQCQIVHDAWHGRGFTQAYSLALDSEIVGYGAVGGSPGSARDIVKEFFVRPAQRADALPLFRTLVSVSGAKRVEAQTNDSLLSLLLYDCATHITSDTILFADGGATALPVPSPGAVVRALDEHDRAHVFPHTTEPVGAWGIEIDRAIVATGGLLFHYNPPYGDLYMEVAAAFRQRGVGSYLVQELRRICYEGGHVPAARCDASNIASRRTLERAGMVVCARILRGHLAA